MESGNLILDELKEQKAKLDDLVKEIREEKELLRQIKDNTKKEQM